jgi:hypothetical protein
MPDGSNPVESAENPWAFDFDPVALKAKYLEERERRVRTDNVQQYITIGRGEPRCTST